MPHTPQKSIWWLDCCDCQAMRLSYQTDDKFSLAICHDILLEQFNFFEQASFTRSFACKAEGWQPPLPKRSTFVQLLISTLRWNIRSTFIHWAKDLIYVNHMASTCDRRQDIIFRDHLTGKWNSNEQRMLKPGISWGISRFSSESETLTRVSKGHYHHLKLMP